MLVSADLRLVRCDIHMFRKTRKQSNKKQNGKAIIIYKYRGAFAVLRYRFPLLYLMSAGGMVIYWISRLLFAILISDG